MLKSKSCYDNEDWLSGDGFLVDVDKRNTGEFPCEPW